MFFAADNMAEFVIDHGNDLLIAGVFICKNVCVVIFDLIFFIDGFRHTCKGSMRVKIIGFSDKDRAVFAGSDRFFRGEIKIFLLIFFIEEFRNTGTSFLFDSGISHIHREIQIEILIPVPGLLSVKIEINELFIVIFPKQVYAVIGNRLNETFPLVFRHPVVFHHVLIFLFCVCFVRFLYITY